jgi:hypothetical protein
MMRLKYSFLALLLIAGCNRGSNLSCFKGHGRDAGAEARAAAGNGDFGFFYYDHGGGASVRTPGVQIDLPGSGNEDALKPIGNQPFRQSSATDASAPMTDCEHKMGEWARRYNRTLCPLARKQGIKCTIVRDEELRDF